MTRAVARRIVVGCLLSAPLPAPGAFAAGRDDPLITVVPVAGPDAPLEGAAKAVREARLGDAMGLIRGAAGAHPEWPPATLILARLQFLAGQNAEGRRTLEKAAAESPDDPRVYLTLGSLAQAEGRFSDARLNAEKALALLDTAMLDAESTRTARREARAALAAAAESREDWASARAHLLAWLESEPTSAPARQRLGRVLFRLGKGDDALKELTRAAKDDPAVEPPAVTMALLFGATGDPAKAAEWFDRAAKAEPRSPRARLAEARWRIDRGQPAEARVALERAAKIDPKSKELEPLRGLVAWQLRELGAAERAFEGLHRDAPADPALANLLALALVEQDDPVKKARGLRLAESNARQFPRSAEALAALGRAYHRSGRLDDAERMLRASVSGGQASNDTAFFLASALADKGLNVDALNLLAAARSLPGAFAYRADADALYAAVLARAGPRAVPPPQAPGRVQKP